ncbi:MAG: hypothetical protein AAF907_04600, partial [Planctomycetota bacterium]
VTGTRSEKEREEPCINCGERHFILPADVYPAPPQTAPAKSRPGESSPKKEKKTAKTPAAEIPPPEPRVPLKTRVAATLRRQATPLRLIGLGLAVVVTVTAWLAIVQARRAAARVTIAEAPAVAEEALADGRFGEAAERFGDVAEAFATLGRETEPRALAAAQFAREATAAANLAPRTPAEIAREAAGVRPEERERWQRLYDSLYRGQWVILDTHAARVATAGRLERGVAGEGEEDQNAAAEPPPPSDRIELLYPLTTPGARFRLIGDRDVPADLKTGDTPRRVVLAGRYGDCVPRENADGSVVWELCLEPGSAFLWAGAGTLTTLGFDLTGPDGAASRALLERQAESLGLPAAGEDESATTDPGDDPAANLNRAARP